MIIILTRDNVKNDYDCDKVNKDNVSILNFNLTEDQIKKSRMILFYDLPWIVIIYDSKYEYSQEPMHIANIESILERI
jgi:hypothetical protein